MKSLWTNNVINVIIVMSFLVTTTQAFGWLEDLQSGRTLSIVDGLKVRVDNITDLDGGVNATKNKSYFSTHLLRIFVNDDMGLTIRKSNGKEGLLQFGLFTKHADGTTAEARGKDANVFGVLLPLLIGAKIAGSIVTTLIAVLVVSVKAFLASVIALFLTGSLALKKLLMGHTPEIHFPVEFMPHPSYGGGYDFPSSSGYSAVGPSAHGGSLSPVSHPSAGGGDFSSSPYGASGHEAVAADSNISAQYASATAPAANTTPTSVHTNTGKRRIFKRKFPILPVPVSVPILTVHKVTRQTL